MAEDSQAGGSEGRDNEDDRIYDDPACFGLTMPPDTPPDYPDPEVSLEFCDDDRPIEELIEEDLRLHPQDRGNFCTACGELPARIG